MKVRFVLGTMLVPLAAAVALASPAMAKGGGAGGGGGGGGGGVTTPVPAVSCAQIVSAIVDPNPLPINPNPVFPEPIVVQLGAPVGPAVAFDLTVNNQCAGEGLGPRSAVAVATTFFDTATGAQLGTGVNMQPAFALMTWRSWGSIPTADTTPAARTVVISVTKANGQVQDTLTYTAAAMNQAILRAVATGTPQFLR